MNQFKFLILSGDGINCENETGLACFSAGIDYDIVHINQLIAHPEWLLNFSGLAIPGGFSFADELGSGQVLALKIKHYLNKSLKTFIAKGSPILGVCNGFQVLTKLGLLSAEPHKRTIALAYNSKQHFINRWVKLTVHHSVCHWTKSMSRKITLPIRHAEGAITLATENSYRMLEKNKQIVLSYTDSNPNGSMHAIAALTDPTGTILGIMPHPEAAVYKTTHPTEYNQINAFSDGYYFFENIKYYLETMA